MWLELLNGKEGKVLQLRHPRADEVRAVAWLALLLSILVSAASPLAAAGAEPVLATISGAHANEATPALVEATQRRLRDRSEARVVGRDFVVSTPQRYDNDEQVLLALSALGYTEADTYFVPSSRVGTRLLVVQFRPTSDDPRAEAIRMFGAIVEQVLAARAEFVAFEASLGDLQRDPARFDWLFWNTPTDDWLIIKHEPRDYFQATLEQVDAAEQPDRALAAAYRARLAQMDLTQGERNAGVRRMKEALADIDAADPQQPVPARLQIGVLRALAFIEAQDGNDERLREIIARYAALIARGNQTVGNVPVSVPGPPGDWQTFSDSTVVVEFDVLPDGSTANPEVLASNASATFTAAVSQVVLRWRFFPAVRDGAVVTSKRRWTYRTERTGQLLPE